MASEEESGTGARADTGSGPRTRILRGAAAVFGAQGFGATTVESILSAAGVSRRTFYKHFRSKEDVLRVLFESSVSMLLDTVRAGQHGGGSPAQRAVAAVEAYIRVHAEAGPLARVLLLEQFSPESPLAAQRDAAMEAFKQVLSATIAREGRPPPDPILVHGVVAGLNQITVQMATESPDGNWDVPRARDAMLRLLSALEPAG